MNVKVKLERQLVAMTGAMKLADGSGLGWKTLSKRGNRKKITKIGVNRAKIFKENYKKTNNQTKSKEKYLKEKFKENE